MLMTLHERFTNNIGGGGTKYNIIQSRGARKQSLKRCSRDHVPNLEKV